MKTVALRLSLSIIVLSALGGCAVYGPGYPAGYYDTEPYGQPVYAAPPAYAAPLYVGPPVFFNFGYRSGNGFRGNHGGDRGDGRGNRGGGNRGGGNHGHR